MIEVINLSKSFKNTNAVKSVNFTIKKNHTLGLLGPNGCGKTTTIGMMLNLIKPSDGKILLDGKNLNKIDRTEVLSMMNFASPYIELPKKLSVRQNLEVYARLYGVKKIFERIDEVSNDL